MKNKPEMRYDQWWRYCLQKIKTRGMLMNWPWLMIENQNRILKYAGNDCVHNIKALTFSL